MPAGVTRLSDVIVPSIFTAEVQQQTTVKSRLIQSGAVVQSPQLNAFLQGAGLTFNMSSFQDLADDAANVSSDDPSTLSSPNKILSSNEKQVRLSRNQSWSSMNLTAEMGNNGDPMQAIANRVSAYWLRQSQLAFIATMKGVFADNDAAPAGTEHVAGDLTFDVKGASFLDGTTNFTAESFIDTTLTMSDEADVLGMVMVHPVVYGRMRKLELIDFIPDSLNPTAAKIPTYQGMQVIQDKAMPSPSSGVFETWIFGSGAVLNGSAPPADATETDRIPAAGNGSGQELLYSRVQWIFHPAGHAYIGTAPNGGPDNTANTHMLAAAGSWQRVFPERNQIRIARLITREF